MSTDDTDDVITALKGVVSSIWGKRVYRTYPPNFAVLPVVSVYTLSQTGSLRGDDAGLAVYETIVNIDVWTKDRIADITLAIQNVMLSNFRQVAYRELSEKDNIIHLVFEYRYLGG